MSYVRFSNNSDVFVFANGMHLECCSCRLLTDGAGRFIHSYNSNSRSDMIEHLKTHIRLGQKVPRRAIQRLKNEIKEIGEYYIPFPGAINDLCRHYRSLAKKNKPGRDIIAEQQEFIKSLKLSHRKLKMKQKTNFESLKRTLEAKKSSRK